MKDSARLCLLQTLKKMKNFKSSKKEEYCMQKKAVFTQVCLLYKQGGLDLAKVRIWRVRANEGWVSAGQGVLYWPLNLGFGTLQALRSLLKGREVS